MIDLTPMFNALIVLMAAIITAFVIPWIKAKATTQQLTMIEGITRTLVFAAEQLYGSGHGEEKLAYVVEKLEAKGYTADLDMIEAQVKAHFGHWGGAQEDSATEEDEPAEEDEEPQTPLM